MRTTFSVAVLVAILSGCMPHKETVKQSIAIGAEETKHYVDSANLSSRYREADFSVKVDNDVYVATELLTADEVLPSIFKEKYNFNKADSLSLLELCSYLNRRTGIMFNRSTELTYIPSTSGQMTDSTVSPAPVSDSPVSGSSVSNESKDYIELGRYRPNLKGVSLTEILDHISSSLGINWRYSQKEGVTFYYYETKLYTLRATRVGYKTSYDGATESGSDGDSGGSAGSSRLKVTTSNDFNFWSGVGATLRSLQSQYGTVSVDPNTGHIVVTDAKPIQARIGAYVRQLNQQLDYHSNLQLTVVRLTQNSSDNYGINFDAIYAAANRYSLGFSTVRNVVDGISAVTGSITDTDSRWNGTKFFIDALSKQADVHDVMTEQFYLRNFVPYHFNNGDTLRFVSDVQIDTTETGTTAGTTKEELFTGFGVSYTANIFDPENMVVDIQTTNSVDNGFTTTLVGETQLRLPQTTDESYLGSIGMRHGETRILQVMEKKRSESSESGAGRPDSMLMGGNRSYSQDRTYIVFLVTAYIEVR